MNKQRVNKNKYDEDDESVDMEPFLKEVDKEVEKSMAQYYSGSWLYKLKYRWHFSKYYNSPLKGLMFTLFGSIK